MTLSSRFLDELNELCRLTIEINPGIELVYFALL